MVYYSPKWIVIDFLRHRLTDPEARNESATSDTFTATASQTDFTVTPTTGSKMSCVTAVTVDDVAQTKNQDYWVDTKNQKVIFFSGQTEGVTVVVSYKEGTSNWIYPDKPRVDLDVDSYPRIALSVVSSPNLRMGKYDAPVESVMRFQADIFTSEARGTKIYTIGGSKYAGEDLAEYLAYQITQAFIDYIDDLQPALYDYVGLSGPRDVAFNKETMTHHKIVEFSLRMINAGEVDWK